MNKKILKKEIKNNKFTLIVISAFILLLVIAFGLYKLLVPSSSSNVKYGNRLDKIEEVLPSDKDLKKVNKKLKEQEIVESAKCYISGRIIKTTVTVKENTDPSKAKELSKVFIESFDEKQIAYFDYEIYIVNSNKEAASYPIIGYKNRSNTNFSYSAAK